mgnify:CR=1 FL=1
MIYWALVMKFQTQSALTSIKIIPLKDADGQTKAAISFEQNIFKTSKISKVLIPKKNFASKIRSKLGMERKFNEIEKFETVEKDESKIDPKEFAEHEKISEPFRNDQAEFECSSIQHPHVMKYENVTLDIVNEQVALIAGKNYTFRNFILKIRYFGRNRTSAFLDLSATKW